MRSSTRTTVTWFLAALFAAVSGAGEGLHFLPGCGHATAVPGGLLYFGVAKRQWTASVDWGGALVGRQAGQGPLIRAEDECAICTHVARGQALGQAVHSPMTLPLLEYLPAVVIPAFSGGLGGRYRARAPPIC
jgi:hypothetical protein